MPEDQALEFAIAHPNRSAHDNTHNGHAIKKLAITINHDNVILPINVEWHAVFWEYIIQPIISKTMINIAAQIWIITLGIVMIDGEILHFL